MGLGPTDTLVSTDQSVSLYTSYNRNGRNDRTIRALRDYGREKLAFDFISCSLPRPRRCHINLAGW